MKLTNNHNVEAKAQTTVILAMSFQKVVIMRMKMIILMNSKIRTMHKVKAIS
jgi:hypothetical protein